MYKMRHILEPTHKSASANSSPHICCAISVMSSTSLLSLVSRWLPLVLWERLKKKKSHKCEPKNTCHVWKHVFTKMWKETEVSHKVASPSALLSHPLSVSPAFWLPPGLCCHSPSPPTCHHCVHDHVSMHVRMRVNVLKCAHVCACVTTCCKSSQSERTYKLTVSWLHQMWQFSPSSCFTFLSPPLLAPPQSCQASPGPHTRLNVGQHPLTQGFGCVLFLCLSVCLSGWS